MRLIGYYLWIEYDWSKKGLSGRSMLPINFWLLAIIWTTCQHILFDRFKITNFSTNLLSFIIFIDSLSNYPLYLSYLPTFF